MAFAAAISDPFRLEFPLYSMGSDRALSRAAIAGKPPKQGAPAEKTDPGKHTGAEVSRFYICLDNLHNVGRCVESQNDGTVITIPGVPARRGGRDVYRRGSGGRTRPEARPKSGVACHYERQEPSLRDGGSDPLRSCCTAPSSQILEGAGSLTRTVCRKVAIAPLMSGKPSVPSYAEWGSAARSGHSDGSIWG
jgi:hypothetical protein